MKQISIYGAGGCGREVAWLLSSEKNKDKYDLKAYIEDGAKGDSFLNEKPVLPLNLLKERHPESLISIAVGDPKTRERLVQKCKKFGFDFASLIHDSVIMSDYVKIGNGSIICCGSIVTVDIEIEEQVHINFGSTIGHDSRIASYSTISPGVHVSGNVHIGKRVFIGTGANIINGTSKKPLIIGDDCVIGAGAAVIENTEPDSLYAGVPAKLIKRYS